MADNTTLNVMTGGDVVADDDIGGVKFQRIKLVHGVDGTNDGDVANTNPFPVSVRQPQSWFEVDVPGVANAAYASGDQFGTIITITNAARASGGTGFINAVQYYDNDDVMGAIDIVIFDSTVTLAADNAVYAVSDADGRKTLAVLNMTYVTDLGAQRFGQLTGISVPYICNGGTSLFAAIITRSAPTPTGGATGQHIRFALSRD